MPDAIPPHMLDTYLAHGWYRMQQTIFTTDVILKNDTIIPVFWIRFLLRRYFHNKGSRKILNACSRFTVTVTGGHITAEAEELYALYKEAVEFDVSDTIQDYLIGQTSISIYSTRCVEVREGSTLIAAGYFDEGNTAMAGILNIFHPGYKKYSLGKFLMLQKIEYALKHNKQYYYPGYISTGISKFDYKLFPGTEHTEVYIRNSDRWMPWLSVQKEQLEEWLFTIG
ncbi:MAG: arginine-tRNA-protein transferase [Chitinophagaceae bacterium]|nr:arginine-tRNA-protein transferase [Chitinophagaceae bacterium]